MGNFDDSLKAVERWVLYVKDTHSLTSFNAAMMALCIEAHKCIEELNKVEKEWAENYPYDVDVIDVIGWDDKFDDLNGAYLLNDYKPLLAEFEINDDKLYETLGRIDLDYLKNHYFEEIKDDAGNVITNAENLEELCKFINEIKWEQVTTRLFRKIKLCINGLLDRMKNPTTTASSNAYDSAYTNYEAESKKKADFENERWQDGRTIYDDGYYDDVVMARNTAAVEIVEKLGIKNIGNVIIKTDSGYDLKKEGIGHFFLKHPEKYFKDNMRNAQYVIRSLELYVFVSAELDKIAASIPDYEGLFESTLSNDLIAYIFLYIADNFIPIIKNFGQWYFPWRVLNNLKLVSDNSQRKFERTMKTWYPNAHIQCREDSMRLYNQYLSTTDILSWNEEEYKIKRNAKTSANAMETFHPVCINFYTNLKKRLRMRE